MWQTRKKVDCEVYPNFLLKKTRMCFLVQVNVAHATSSQYALPIDVFPY